MTPEQLLEDLAFLGEWEERFRYIIDLGRRLPPLEDGQRVDANLVPGCLSRVWLAARIEGEGPGARLHLRADSDAHITKGLVAIALTLYDGRTAGDILQLDLDGFFDKLDLGSHISVNRRNGFVSMLGKIRAIAADCVGQAS